MCICASELIEKLKQYPPDTDIYVSSRCAKGYGEVLQNIVEEIDGTLTLTSDYK